MSGPKTKTTKQQRLEAVLEHAESIKKSALDALELAEGSINVDTLNEKIRLTESFDSDELRYMDKKNDVDAAAKAVSKAEKDLEDNEKAELVIQTAHVLEQAKKNTAQAQKDLNEAVMHKQPKDTLNDLQDKLNEARTEEKQAKQEFVSAKKDEDPDWQDPDKAPLNTKLALEAVKTLTGSHLWTDIKKLDQHSIDGAYRKLALKYHPDKGAEKDPAKFYEIKHAHECVNDYIYEDVKKGILTELDKHTGFDLLGADEATQNVVGDVLSTLHALGIKL